jgi:hypothetical protein
VGVSEGGTPPVFAATTLAQAAFLQGVLVDGTTYDGDPRGEFIFHAAPSMVDGVYSLWFTQSSQSGTGTFLITSPVIHDVNNSLKAMVSINGQPSISIAIIQDNPPTAWNAQGQDITSQLTSEGVNVAALLQEMQAIVVNLKK